MKELKLLVLELMARVQELEATVTRQQKELEALKKPALDYSSGAGIKAELVQIEQLPTTSMPNPTQRTRRTFLTRLAKTGLLACGIGLAAVVSTGQKDAAARILVNPVDYPIQFGAITTPPGTTISGTLGDTSVRVGLAACGDPAMDYAKLPLFDAGVYAQGAGYGVYAATDRAMGNAGYFRNTATSGVGSFYAITAISDKGTAISASGTASGIGVAGSSSGSGSGMYGSSITGPGINGFSVTGAGVNGASSTGVPLHLQVSNSVPVDGTRAKGDFYLDTLGRVYVWARNDANSADVWRQVQFVPA